MSKGLRTVLERSENRSCADCSVTFRGGEIWAVLNAFPHRKGGSDGRKNCGVFICVNCVAAWVDAEKRDASAARQPGVLKSVLKDRWTETEISAMQDGEGNAWANQCMEQYVPASWVKPQPDSDHETRVCWIVAKYRRLLFVLPNSANSSLVAKPDRSEGAGASLQIFANADVKLPSRLVDHFLICGLPEAPSLELRALAPGLPPPPTPEESSPEDQSSPEPVALELFSLSPKVLDLYPPSDSFQDCSVPEHIMTFCFPEGFTLTKVAADNASDHERDVERPAIHSFVLTDASGVRLYATSLRVHEEVTVRDYVEHLQGRPDVEARAMADSLRHASESPQAVVSAPKALVIVSHYPFFDLFRAFLAQLYRVSLSKSPLPIERYISNFVCEVPLPPQGQVEVKVPLPDKIAVVSRAPRNELPEINYSLRPLFQLLSLDNIITVVGCLLMECKVAFISSHISVLTPVSSALISFLFPLSWQCPWIPVAPSTMIDILDAPVPFIVGLHRSAIEGHDRPPEVVYVDLDQDTIELGIDEETNQPRQPLELPARALSKLRERLTQIAATLHGPRSPEVALADLAFPENEHLLPIHSFGLESGLLETRKSSAGSQASQTTSAFRGGFKAFGSKKSGAPNGGPTEIDVDGSGGSVPGIAAGGTADLEENSEPRGHLHEPIKVQWEAEIRAEFLRLFTFLFQGYEKWIVQGGEFDQAEFLRNATHLPTVHHNGMRSIMKTQMFQRFTEDIKHNPDQPYIRFFNEKIIEKINRSIMSSMKKRSGTSSTPFLDDQSDAIAETFQPPPPSNWGLPDDGTMYTYPRFPSSLDNSAFGTVRRPVPLVKRPELVRSAVPAEALVALAKRNRSHRERSRDQQAEGGGAPLSNMSNQELSGNDPGDTAAVESAGSLIDGVLRIEDASARIWTLVSALDKLRAHWKDNRQRAAHKVIRESWLRYRRRRETQRFAEKFAKQVAQIQGLIRRRRAIRDAQLRAKTVVYLQATVRRLRAYSVLKRAKASATLLSRRARGFVARSKFLRELRAAIFLQSVERGRRHRCEAKAQRQDLLTRMRRHVTVLWDLAHVPLAYRSRFWTLFDGSGFLHLALHEEEIRSLWTQLNLLPEDGLGSEEAKSSRGAEESSSEGIPRKPSLALIPTLEHMESALQPASSTVAKAPWSRLENNVNAQKEEGAERKNLYASLKKQQKSEKKSAANSTTGAGDEDDSAITEAFFQAFSIEGGHRKKKLADSVWDQKQLNRDPIRLGDISAQVVLSCFGTDTIRLSGKDFAQQKVDRRVRSDVLSTVQACLASIQILQERERLHGGLKALKS